MFLVELISFIMQIFRLSVYLVELEFIQYVN